MITKMKYFLRSIHSQEFQLHKQTGDIHEIVRNTKPVNSYAPHDYVHIINVVQRIYRIYLDVKYRKLNVKRDKSFLAIARYFKLCLKEICTKRSMALDRLYLVFVTPNKWAKESDIINLVMLPLLSEIGVMLPHNYTDRASFLTKLEAGFANLQLNSRNKQSLPSFFHNENRCVMYSLYEDNATLEVNSMYFQLKENYNLRAINDKYYTPKLISTAHSSVYEPSHFSHAKYRLKKIIFEPLNLPPSILSSNDGIADAILDTILHNVIVCEEVDKDSCITKSICNSRSAFGEIIIVSLSLINLQAITSTRHKNC